jgi:LmbE family N-acetylglucosaminyl deacetylase
MTAPEAIPAGPILGVWAHPDDETFLSAGLMVEALRRGQRVVCVTATRGELGIQDVDRWPPDQLAAIRTAELEKSLAILGVTEHHWLDYPDGGCHEVDVEEAVGLLRSIFEDVQPASVLTFGPDGMTAHTDHIAVSAWTTLAFERYAPTGSSLYYATMSEGWWETYAELFELDRIVMSTDWEPPTSPAADIVIDHRVVDEVFELKKRSLLAQESQIGAMMQALPPEHVWEVNRHEYYRLGGKR